VRALDLDGVELVVLNLDVGVLGDLVALDLVLTLDWLVGSGVDHELLEAVACLTIQAVEAHPL
jgi:hypothetical protein